MKRVFYFYILGFCLFISIFLFVLYHFQDFSSEISFNDDFEISADDSNGFLRFVESPIGVLKISNKGIFSKYYEFPSFVGCLEFSNYSNIDIYSMDFEIYLKELGFGKNDLFLESKKDFSYTVVGRYFVNSNKISFNDIKENVVGFKIYNSPKEKDFYSSLIDSVYGKSEICLDLEKNYEPVYSSSF